VSVVSVLAAGVSLLALACLAAMLVIFARKRRARRLHHDLHSHMVSEEFIHALECQGADPEWVDSIRQDNARMRYVRMREIPQEPGQGRVIEFDLHPTVKRAMVPLGEYIKRLP